MEPSPRAVLDEAFGEPEDRPTIAESVAARLRELILTGKLPPGTPLRLTQVATRMGVSVMPIREAIRILEAERLVTIEPRRGAAVAHLSIDDIEELYAVRAALEGLAAKHGARAIGARDVKAMRTEFNAMTRASEAGDTRRLPGPRPALPRAALRRLGARAAGRSHRRAARERAPDRRPVRLPAVVSAQGRVRGAPPDPRGRRAPRRGAGRAAHPRQHRACRRAGPGRLRGGRQPERRRRRRGVAGRVADRRRVRATVRSRGARVGVDVGGTFTDIVITDPDGAIHTGKLPSTPDDFSARRRGGRPRRAGPSTTSTRPGSATSSTAAPSRPTRSSSARAPGPGC